MPEKLPRSSGTRRPGTTPAGSRRPKEAPRPKRPSDASAAAGPPIRLSCPTFIDLTVEQELLATGALAELLVPLLTTGADVTPVVDT